MGFVDRLLNKQTGAEQQVDEVEQYLNQLGYNITAEGIAAAWVELENDSHPAEVASQLALTTIAQDVRKAEIDASRLMKIFSYSMATLRVLKDFKDLGLMREHIWTNDTRAVYEVTYIDKGQMERVDQVLSDSVAGNRTVAVSRFV